MPQNLAHGAKIRGFVSAMRGLSPGLTDLRRVILMPVESDLEGLRDQAGGWRLA